jgi:uncharacterized pyridoxamine 5'-phosphate oxidase family protein
MNKQEMLELMRSNPAFYLATVDGDQPRVRGMLLYKADENGLVFHSGGCCFIIWKKKVDNVVPF